MSSPEEKLKAVRDSKEVDLGDMGINVRSTKTFDLGARKVTTKTPRNYCPNKTGVKGGIIAAREPFAVDNVAAMKSKTETVHQFVVDLLKGAGDDPEKRHLGYLSIISLMSVLSSNANDVSTFMHALLFCDSSKPDGDVVAVPVPAKTMHMFNPVTKAVSNHPDLCRKLNGRRVISYTSMMEIGDLMHGPFPHFCVRQITSITGNAVAMDRPPPQRQKGTDKKQSAKGLDTDGRAARAKKAQVRTTVANVLRNAGVEMTPAEKRSAAKMFVTNDGGPLARSPSSQSTQRYAVFIGLGQIEQMVGEARSKYATRPDKKPEADTRMESLKKAAKRRQPRKSQTIASSKEPAPKKPRKEPTPPPAVPTSVPTPMEVETDMYPIPDTNLCKAYLERDGVKQIILSGKPSEDAIGIVKMIDETMDTVRLDGLNPVDTRLKFVDMQRAHGFKFGHKSAMFILTALLHMLIEDYGDNVSKMPACVRFQAMSDSWGDKRAKTLDNITNFLPKIISTMDEKMGVSMTDNIIAAIVVPVICEDEDEIETDDNAEGESDSLNESTDLFGDDEDDDDDGAIDD